MIPVLLFSSFATNAFMQSRAYLNLNNMRAIIAGASLSLVVKTNSSAEHPSQHFGETISALHVCGTAKLVSV
jgi:hypothetical protein